MPSNTRPTEMTQTALHSTGAYELVFSALLVGFGGFLLDRWLGTSPILLLTFAVLGFLGAAASLYYRFKFQMQALAEEEA